jgi:hypothetical protein
LRLKYNLNLLFLVVVNCCLLVTGRQSVCSEAACEIIEDRKTVLQVYGVFLILIFMVVLFFARAEDYRIK